VVTYLFPPVNAVGIHRPVALARRLARKDWRVTVLTARPAPGQWRDTALDAGLEAAVRVVRTPSPDLPAVAARWLKPRRKAKPESPAGEPPEPQASGGAAKAPSGLRRFIDWGSWWLHVPDSVSGWFAPALRAGLREMRRRRPDVLFATGPPWTPLVVAAALSVLGRVPLVADFRDPWHGSPWHPIPYAAHRAFRGWLEARVVHTAKRITCAWHGIERLMCERYPQRAHRIATVLNGFDVDKMDAIAPSRSNGNCCTLIHIGNFYVHRSPEPLFDGLRRVRDRHPEARARLRVALVGGERYGDRPLADLADACGVADMVRCVGPRPHREALGMLKGADAALLFGQSGSESLASVPGKVYEYIGAGKAVLAVGAGEEACRVLRRGGCRVWAVPADAPGRIAEALDDILTAHRAEDLRTAPDPGLRDAFSQTRMAERLESVLVEAMHSQR
jgi:glycosyltransferase involved in cell wall biosynthesis